MKTLLKTLSLGLAILLASCSQDLGEEVLKATNQSVTVKLSIEAEVEDEDLRGSLRNLTATFHKANNWIPEISKLKKGDQLSLNLVFSNGEGLIHRQATFTADEQGKLVFAGDIDVPGYNVDKPWYVTAIYGGIKNNDAYNYTPKLYALTDGDKFGINAPSGGIDIPYMSGWTLITSSKNTKTHDPEGVFKLKLRPLGYLLRLQVTNARDHKIALRRFEIESEDFTLNANFSPSNKLTDMQKGLYPNVSDFSYSEGQGRSIPTANNENELDRGDKIPTTSKTYLAWVMPLKKVAADATFTAKVLHYKKGAEWIFPFKVKVKGEAEFGMGGLSGVKSLKIRNDYKIYRIPYTIDYVALGNIDKAGKEVAEGQLGYNFSWNEYKKDIYISRDGYTMDPGDWINILPRSNSKTTAEYTTYNGRHTTRDGTEFFNGDPATVNIYGYTDIKNTDSYKRGSNGSTRILYAVRKLTSVSLGIKGAFRYTMEQNGDITVEMVHLDGKYNSSPSIDEVSTSKYWDDAYAYGEVVKRIFPGQGTRAGLSRAGNRETYYMGISTTDKLQAPMWNYDFGRVGHYIPEGGISSTIERQVRIKRDELVDLRPNPIPHP